MRRAGRRYIWLYENKMSGTANGKHKRTVIVAINIDREVLERAYELGIDVYGSVID